MGMGGKTDALSQADIQARATDALIAFTTTRYTPNRALSLASGVSVRAVMAGMIPKP